jgi:hypothetical protein
MSLTPLLDIINSSKQDSWAEPNGVAFTALFGSPEGRYPKQAAKEVTLRAPEMGPAGCRSRLTYTLLIPRLADTAVYLL